MFCKGKIRDYHSPPKIINGCDMGGEFIYKCDKCGYIDDAGICLPERLRDV